MDWRNTAVEVDLPNGACYQASIKDITESGILVVFKDDLKPETSVTFEKVRLFPHQDEGSFDFKQGDIIQVYSKDDEDQIEGWWKAKIQVLKRDNCFIEYIDRDGMDLVKKNNIRQVKQGEFFRKLIVKVPKHLKAICEEAGIHSEFIKHSGVLAVIYSRASSSLIFVSTSEDLNKKAELLTDLHVKALREKLQHRQYQEKHKHTETFMVSSDLMGLAIGTKGSNIKKAERMKGIGSVTKVESEGGYHFKICGESTEAVKQARGLLEFKKEQLTVPHNLAGRIIGKAGQAIDEIINKSMVDRIIRQTEPDGVVFNIIGTPESIKNAKMLLNFKLDALKNTFNSKRGVEDTERSEVLSDDENSSDFIGIEQIEQICSQLDLPNRGRGNRAGRGGRGGRGSRLRGSQRGRNNRQQAENTQNQNNMRSNVIQQDVRTTTGRNDRYLHDSLSKELPSNSGESSDEKHSSASINSELQNPHHQQQNRGRWNGNSSGRGGRRGRGSRFSGDHRGGNINQQAENAQNQINRISNVIQHDVRTNVRNEGYLSDFKTRELIADSENSSDDTHSCTSINSEQHNPVHRQPNRGRWNGNRPRSRGRGGRYRGRQKSGDNQPNEGQSVHLARVNQEKEGGCGKYDDFIAGTSQSKQIEVDDNVRSIAFEQSSGGVRHKDTRNKPRAKDTGTSSDEASFPKYREDRTNKRHQGRREGYEDSDEWIHDDSLSHSCGNSHTQSGKTYTERTRKDSNSSIRGIGVRERKGSRTRGGSGQRHHHQHKHQMTDDSDENINSDVEIMEVEYLHLSSGFDEKFSTGEDVTKSLAKFNALLEDTPKAKVQVESKKMKEKPLKEEALDKINEMEVLKFLVQTFGSGCSFGLFVCTANSLFPYCVRMKEWFNTRSRKFHIYRDGPEIVYIGPFYKDLNICKHFFNPSKPTICDNQNCNFFHICRNFVRGNCRRQHCSFSHDFASALNVRIKEKYGLEDFTDSDIIVLLNWKFPRLCPHYIYEHGGCKDTENKEEACPYLHYCKNHFFGKCDRGDDCRYNHSFSDSHSRWVLTSCHLANQKEDNLKRMIYVPPNLENLKEQVNTEDFSVDDLSREETIKSTTYQHQTDGRRRFKHLSTSESKFIGNQPTIQEKMGIRFSLSSEITVTEDTPESDDSLLTEAAGKKHICLALTKKECPSSVCSDLHLTNGVPYLWQVKMDSEWVSFLPKDNFKIENAYCSLEQNVHIKDIVYSGKICTVHIRFEIVDEHMYGDVFDTTGSGTNRVDVRRLSTPSFGERYMAVDCYLTQWRWYWKNDHGIWLCYDTDLQTYTLEVKFLKKQKTYLFSRENYKQKYRLSFNSMEQVNLEYGTTRVLIRRPSFVSKEDLQKKKYPKKIVSKAIELYGEDSKPAHFYPWDLSNEFELVEIVSSFTSEYNDVLSSFQKTMNIGKYEVRSIYRVQSRKLWSEFETKKKHMHADAEKDNPTFSSIDERTLFHGTDSLDVCRGICINNFDFRKSGKNATVFGEGSYFARDAIYSHSYTKASSDFGDRYMFRAKVLVGKFTAGSSKYRRPPEIPGQSHKLYDSCVDHPVDPKIFVIFDRSQSYPEYLINYREKDYGLRRISSGTTHTSVSSYPSSTGTSQQPIHQRMPSVSSAYSSGGTSLGVAQKPVQSSMHSTSSTAYSSGGTSFGTATRFNTNSISASNSPSGSSSGTSSRYNPVSNSASSMGNNSSSSGNQPSSSQNYTNTGRKQDKDCVIL